MRRSASALLLLCLACSGGSPVAPAQSEAFNADAPGAGPIVFTPIGIDAAAAEDTARAFLEAYERPRTAAERHAEIVAGDDLRHWVHWIKVQNEGLPLLPRGEVEIAQLQLIGLSPLVAEVACEAVVTLRFRNVDGDVAASRRAFTTPMVLVRANADAPWKVLDAVRDGRSMVFSISTLRPPARSAAGDASVAVVSVFRFEVRTFVNVRVRNDGTRPMRLDFDRSLLVVGGQALRGLAATASLLKPVPPGETVEGGLSFATIPLEAIPEGVVIHLEGESPIDVEIPLPPDPFEVPLQSNSGGGGSSSA